MKKFVAVLSAAAMMTGLARLWCHRRYHLRFLCRFGGHFLQCRLPRRPPPATATRSPLFSRWTTPAWTRSAPPSRRNLDAKAAEKGITIEYKDFNGQNDATTLNPDRYPGGFGRPTMQSFPSPRWPPRAWPTACESTKTPVISTPPSRTRRPPTSPTSTYVTGTSDALNTKSILDMMLAVQPDVKTVGLLYSNSEPTPRPPSQRPRNTCDSKGISYIEKTGNTNDEILTAAASMVGQVDAVLHPYRQRWSWPRRLLSPRR